MTVTTWTHAGVDLEALAARLAARLPSGERSLRTAGLGREDLLCEARLAVADLVRTHDPAKGPLEAWVLGGAWRVGADLARRGVGRVHRDDAAVQRALRTVVDEAGSTPERAAGDVVREVCERTKLPAASVRRSLAALRDRAALGGVEDLEPAAESMARGAGTDSERAADTRRMWSLVGAASRLDAEHAGQMADGDDDDVEPLRALLPGTLGLLVLARQAGGATLLDLSRETDVPVRVLAEAARVVADLAREVVAAHSGLAAAR